MRGRHRLLVFLAVMALMAVACGRGEETTDTTAAEPEPTTATTEAMDDTTETTEAMDDTTETTEAMAEIATDIGVEGNTIKIGMLADQTGLFSGLVNDIVDAQVTFWEGINAAGGVGGYEIELVVEDTGYDVPTHVEKYNALRDEVLMIAQSTGSPHTAAIAEQMAADNIVAIPLSWYSGWGDAELGRFILEQGTNYCLEGMNMVDFVAKEFEAANGRPPTVAVATFPGEYGQDGAAGAKVAIEELGLELVYDGEAAVIPGQDQTAVITEIVNSSPDVVFATVNASTLAELMGGVAQAGLTPQWTGSGPSYSFLLLDTPVAQLLDQFWTGGTYYAFWGADAPGVQEVMAAMTEKFPDRPPSDAFIRGWAEGLITKAILEQAISNGDLTRAGVVEAALQLENIPLNGLAPDQAYAGTPNDYVNRASVIYKPDLEAFLAGGGFAGTMSGGGVTGVDVQDLAYISDVAANFDFQTACFSG